MLKLLIWLGHHRDLFIELQDSLSVQSEFWVLLHEMVHWPIVPDVFVEVRKILRCFQSFVLQLFSGKFFCITEWAATFLFVRWFSNNFLNLLNALLILSVVGCSILRFLIVFPRVYFKGSQVILAFKKATINEHCKTKYWSICSTKLRNECFECVVLSCHHSWSSKVKHQP